MPNFLQWRKMTWVLVVWSPYIATWAVVTDPGLAMAAVWWFAGTGVFGLLWRLPAVGVDPPSASQPSIVVGASGRSTSRAATT